MFQATRSGRNQKLEETTESEEEEDDDDYYSPRKTSTKDLLANIPPAILNLDEDRPERVATKSLRYIFTEEEILTCMLPPVGKNSQRKPFPPKKVEILYALLEQKFPNLDPITYASSVKSAVGEYCRCMKTKKIMKAASKK
ncbi:hypothetical protein B566_EDAN016292 [Ephemera danica]|nr:hypothetical protein B566_EDAN016292 [Ephemera danica]